MLRGTASEALWMVKAAALFGVTLLFLSACGSGVENAVGTGNSDTENAVGTQNASGAGTDDGNGSSKLIGEGSDVPISERCRPPDMENCYGYKDMQDYGDMIIPMVEQFFDTTYADMPHPRKYVYVSKGETVSSACTGDSTDEAYEYCPADETIYLGQRSLWKLYSDAGDAAPAVGLAHEWGHHVQAVVGVPPAETSVGQISRENQADCIAGAWTAYADEQKWLNYPDDVKDIASLLKLIAQEESGRDHGDLTERTDSLQLGIEYGLQGCNDFFPDSPVIASSSASPSASSTASSSPSTSPSSTASAEADAVIDAAVDYYRYVESGEYSATYDLLSSEDQDYYTQDEWVTANTNLDSAAVEYSVTDATVDDLDLGIPTYAVTVTGDRPDGSSFDRTTYFTFEDDSWAHYLSREEVDTFDEALN